MSGDWFVWLVLRRASSFCTTCLLRSVGKKDTEYRTPWGVLVGCSSPLLKPWACRWINHLSLWFMASATPDLRLPSQSQDIAGLRLVPNYTAWWQRHVCEQLAQGCYLTAERPGVELTTSQVAIQRPNHNTTRPLANPGSPAKLPLRWCVCMCVWFWMPAGTRG